MASLSMHWEWGAGEKGESVFPAEGGVAGEWVRI